VSNVLGTVNPIEEIVRKAHDAGWQSHLESVKAYVENR
jgi:selenocysteine lyase/cysteine desulfurase